MVWPSVEVPQIGISAELAHQVHVQGADAIDELLLADRAIDYQVLERLELLRCDNAGNMGQIAINTRLFRVTARAVGVYATLRA